MPLSTDQNGRLVLRETLGLSHRRQVLAVSLPESLELPERFTFRETTSGRCWAAQRSKVDPAQAFVQIELGEGEELTLVPEAGEIVVDGSVSLTEEAGCHTVSNGEWRVRIPAGDHAYHRPGEAPGPLQGVAVSDGPWRGRTFLDTTERDIRVTTEIRERGPVRSVIRYRATLGSDGDFYEATMTFDAGVDFIRMDESFQAGAGDQVVWDFTGEDLPKRLLRLDSSAAYAEEPLHYFIDYRLARLACWTQYSQLSDFSDGFALALPEGEAIGFVTLEGGDWRGNAHNFLEAWTRRWWKNDPASRRLRPAGSKADASPAPESVTLRSAHRSDAHFQVEGWLQAGRRSFALVLTTREALRPIEERPVDPLGPYEAEPDRPRYRRQQSRLRQIAIQHGVFPLQDQLALCWLWPRETPIDRPGQPEQAEISVATILSFLSARVHGFWEGAGPAYTNPVVSRKLAPYMEEWERLEQTGRLSPIESMQGRAWFAFLIQLFHREHYYPGAAAMTTTDETLTLEPAFEGMANQNFFTDVFNVGGMGAQVFHRHPDAEKWRERFGAMWRRQLEYHVYPESGVWEESHTYFHHVLFTVIPTLERRLEDGVDNWFAESAFQKLAASLLKTLTPRDACHGHLRHTAPLGDHGVDIVLYRPLYRTLANHFVITAPVLAGHLAWAYREMGGEESLNIAPQPIAWADEYVQGLGYFFRAQGTGAPSLLILRSSQAWAHHHNDDGSVQFYAEGRAWIVDSAFSYPQQCGARKIRADGHSRWTLRDIHPINYLWQFNRGWLLSHETAGAFPHALAFTPVYMAETPGLTHFALRRPVLHWGAVVRLSPTAFLIIDRSDIAIAQTVRFHVPADADVALKSAPPPSPGKYLRIDADVPLHESPDRDVPTTAGEHFATREIRADYETNQPVIFLIAVEDQTSALTIERHESALIARAGDFAARIENDGRDTVTIINLHTSETLRLTCSE